MNYKKLHPNAQLHQPKEGDAGIDLYCLDGIYIQPGEIRKIKIGIALEIPTGFFGKIFERSSVGSKGIAVRGGVIDSSYRGEIIVVLENLGSSTHYFESGSKIAQLVLIPYAYQDWLNEVDEISETERGDGGFGSTGK